MRTPMLPEATVFFSDLLAPDLALVLPANRADLAARMICQENIPLVIIPDDVRKSETQFPDSRVGCQQEE